MALLRFVSEVTRNRYGAGSWGTDGAYDPPAATPTTGILVDIQPLSGRDLATLPEAEREADVRWMYAEPGTFRTGSQHGQHLADRVVYTGSEDPPPIPASAVYEVRAVQEHTRLLRHQKCRIVRLKE